MFIYANNIKIYKCFKWSYWIMNLTVKLLVLRETSATEMKHQIGRNSAKRAVKKHPIHDENHQIATKEFQIATI